VRPADTDHSLTVVARMFERAVVACLLKPGLDSLRSPSRPLDLVHAVSVTAGTRHRVEFRIFRSVAATFNRGIPAPVPALTRVVCFQQQFWLMFVHACVLSFLHTYAICVNTRLRW
jgi:hypothetical protein